MRNPRGRFRHSTPLDVRNYEVDWQGIVHNANYLLYFETGRIAYLRHLGLPVDLRSIKGNSRVVLVRNEINYRAPALFGDRLTVWTRVAAIGTTSFVFEGEIRRSGKLLADNRAVHVWLHPSTGRPVRVRRGFRQAVGKFEGEGRGRAPDLLPREEGKRSSGPPGPQRKRRR